MTVAVWRNENSTLKSRTKTVHYVCIIKSTACWDPGLATAITGSITNSPRIVLLNSKYNHNIGLLDSTIVFIYLNLWLYDLRKSHISSVDLHSQSLHLYGVAANILFFSIFLPTWNQCWDKWGTCLLCGVVGVASGHLGGTQIIPASLTSNINWFLLENNLITSEKLSPTYIACSANTWA